MRKSLVPGSSLSRLDWTDMSEFQGVPFPFRPPTPEELEEMQRQQVQHEMHLTEFRHSFQRMFEELDENQLSTIQTMFHLLVDGETGRLASYWEGLVAWERKKRFNICTTCGTNHDEELTSDPERHSVVPDPRVKETIDLNPEVGVEQWPVDGQGYLIINDQQRAMLDRYHLDDVYSDPEEGNMRFLGFKCTGIQGAPIGGCGMIYTSLSDRMLKGPESCSGCHQRIMHG